MQGLDFGFCQLGSQGLGQRESLGCPKDGVSVANAFGRIEHVLGSCLAGGFDVASFNGLHDGLVLVSHRIF